MKKISTTHFNPKKVMNKFGTIVTQTFNMDQVLIRLLDAANSGVSLGILLVISPVLELSNKCILWYKRLGYFTSIQRIIDTIRHQVITGVDSPSSVQVKDFPT